MSNVGVSLASPPDLPAMPPFPASAYGYIMTCALVYRAQPGDVFWWNDATWGDVTEWKGNDYAVDGAGTAAALQAYQTLCGELQQEDATLEGQGIPVFEWAILVAPTNQYGDLSQGSYPVCGNTTYNEWITQQCYQIQQPYIPPPISINPPPNPNPPPPPTPNPNPNPNPNPQPPPCPPWSALPDCFPQPPGPQDDQDEIGDLEGSTTWGLTVIALAILNVYEAILGSFGGSTGEGNPDPVTCAQLTGLFNSLTAQVEAVAQAVAEVDISPTDLSALIAAVDSVAAAIAAQEPAQPPDLSVINQDAQNHITDRTQALENYATINAQVSADYATLLQGLT
jgi:hypothetical protein